MLPAIVIMIVVAGCGDTGGAPDHGHHHDPDGRGSARIAALAPPAPVSPAAVSIRATIPGTVRAPLPRSFLGLSFEYWDLGVFDAHPVSLKHVLALLRVSRDGPVVLRIGGDSADQAYWGYSPSVRLGPWPFHITPRWLRTLRSLVRADHVRVMLDLNLADRSPAMAARFAKAALRRLPHHSVVAFEIGNEPDIYHHWVDYHLKGRASLFVAPSGWDEYSPTRYAQTFTAYARALKRVAPRVPLAGPESAYPLRDIAWERRLLSTNLGRVGMLTVHRYPLTACGRASRGNFSTIARVLSPTVSAGLRPAVSPALQLADETDLPLRMTELNSVTCEGRRGVSNTFAAALWAPDALFSLWRTGLAGVNIHVRQDAPNAAFSMTPAGLAARPLLYGLALFARALGNRGQLARLRVGLTVPSVRLWAVRNGHRLNVLALDKGPHPAHLMLRVPSHRLAIFERLLAPAINSTRGETLAGQSISPDGRWVGRRKLQTLARSGRRYRLTVPAYSAALITFRI